MDKLVFESGEPENYPLFIKIQEARLQRLLDYVGFGTNELSGNYVVEGKDDEGFMMIKFSVSRLVLVERLQLVLKEFCQECDIEYEEENE